MERNVIPVDFRTIKAFVSLEFSGGIGMLILLSSALLSQTQLRIKRPYNAGSTFNEAAIHRSRTWFSFCISWIISCFSYCLLFLAGKQLDTSKPPSFGLCLTQAALIYSAPPLTGATTSALFYDVWLMFRLASVRDHSLGRATRVLLLAAPYVMWMIITVALVITGGLTPEIVEHNLENDPFCVMKPNAIPLFIALLTLIFALAALGMLIVLSVNLYQTRKASAHWSPSRNQKQSSALVIRIIIFGICGMIAVGISIVFVLNRAPNIKSYLVQAVLPPVAVLVFGSQKDFLRFWLNLLMGFIRSACLAFTCGTA